MMQLKNYVVTVRGYGTKHRIATTARTRGLAIQIVMAAEKCPRSAIVDCEPANKPISGTYIEPGPDGREAISNL
jgi:hypothetical protein